MSTVLLDRPKTDRSTLSFVPELVYFEPSALDYPKRTADFRMGKKGRHSLSDDNLTQPHHQLAWRYRAGTI